MPKIQIFHNADKPFIDARPEPGGESEGSSRVRHPGGDDELQLFEVRVRPNHHVEIHAHAEGEILYVLEGELRVGGRSLPAGDSIYIAGMTLYTFDTGPEGVRFLNFRARQDLTYYTKDEFKEFKTLDPAGRAAMNDRLIKARMDMLGWE